MNFHPWRKEIGRRVGFLAGVMGDWCIMEERWFGNFVIFFFSFLKERYGRIWWKDVVTLFEK